MRRSGPGYQSQGQYRQGPPPPGYRSRNLQAGGPGFQGPSLQQQRREEQMRRQQELEFERRVQAEAEARYRQQQREEQQRWEQQQREQEMRRREEAAYRRGGGGRPGPRSKNLHTPAMQRETMRENEAIRQYREDKKRRKGPGFFSSMF
jgi:hypothetical protein